MRVEQLFPLPVAAIQEQLAAYKGVEDVVWAQEEPRNMGLGLICLLHMPEAARFRPATRRFYGAPAAGSATRFRKTP